MASNLISSLLSLCSNLLPSIRASARAPSSSSSSNYSQNGGAAEEDLERMMRTLELIKATLYDAEEREIRDRSVKLWLKELKKVAYAAEDVLSECRYEVTRVQVESRKASEASGSHKRKEMECIIPIPDSIMEQLNKIRKRFEEIAKDREDLQLKESDGARRLNNRNLRPPTGHMVDESSIFGREAETMEVIDLLLLEKEKPFFVIAIIGKGGLGKTTIAQLVYKDAEFRRCFDSFGWVCVSEEFDVGKLINATIESITKKNCCLSELSLLQEQLAQIVKGKKIFVVLDDVWNENGCLWELFRIPFQEAEFVRILVTAREKKFVKYMQTMACFKPSYLSTESCWELFHHYAYGNTSCIMSTDYVNMGKEIVKKCGGLPLAVKSIASLLRQTTDEESWKEILESDLWESNPSNEVFSALQISYSYLPTTLKPCLLFCSMYPKDHQFKKMRLIELWLSHGYIMPRGKKRIAEIGIEYYEELKERSFLEDSSDRLCKLHDIIHDLARLNSENEHYSVDINQPLNTHEEKNLREAYHLYATGFMGYLDQIPQQNFKGLKTLSLNVRSCNGALEHRHCINSGILEYYPSQFWEKQFHTFCLKDTIIFDLAKFKALKVLELKGDHVREIPDSIKYLKSLTYFRITSHSLKKLPSSIGLLYNLQIFILDCWDSPLEYLPESIGNLLNLRYMCIKCFNLKKIPVTLCSLSNLQRLAIETDNSEEIPSDATALGNLQELKVRYRKRTKSLSGEGHFQFMGALSDLLIAFANCSQLKTLRTSGCFVNYTPHDLNNFSAMRTMAACLRVKTIGWLKNMKDLEGDLIIEGLENTSNLVDVQNANLRNKSRIKTLDLCWHDRKHKHRGCLWICTIPKELTIRLIKESDKVIPVGGDLSCGMLEFLQPHSQLKKLILRGYPSTTVPNWMGDTLSLKAIQEIILQDCNGLQFLPFRNLQTLKHVRIQWCLGFCVLQLEQLPTQLETLEIIWCKHLELITGVQNLPMLTRLKVSSCAALKSITVDGPESMEAFGNSSHEVQQCTLPLTVLDISCCPLLNALP